MQKKLDSLLEHDLKKGQYIGANAAVYKDGNCLYSRSVGFADRENNQLMTENSIFRIYSMTKPVTAVAALQLMERGMLHPDDPVSYFFPGFAHARIFTDDGKIQPASRDITVRDLLNMTSGLPYANISNPTQRAVDTLYKQMEVLRGTEAAWDLEEYCERMAEIPLEFTPGSRWDYGTSADILGGVIQKASNMEFRQYLQKHIFSPLGMTDTDFYVPEDKQERFAASYCFSETGLVRDDGCYLGLNDFRSLPDFISGGAGLSSTITDYARFACTLAEGGTSPDGVRLLSPAAMAYLRTPQVFGEKFQKDQQWESLQGYGYGNLVRILMDPAKAGTFANRGEFGWDGWTGTYFCVDPAEKLAILFWIQVACAGTSRTAKCMRNIVYANL